MKTVSYRLTALLVIISMSWPLFAKDLFIVPTRSANGGFLWNQDVDKLLTEAPEPAPAPKPSTPSYTPQKKTGPSTGAIVCYALGGTLAGVGALLAIIGVATYPAYDDYYYDTASSDSDALIGGGLGLLGGGGLLALLGLLF
jgi:hypothetical protein